MDKQEFMDLIEREARANFGSETGVEGHGRYSFATRINHGTVFDDGLTKLVIFIETRMLNGLSIYGLEWGVRQEIPIEKIVPDHLGTPYFVKGATVFGYLQLGGLDDHPIQNSAKIHTSDFEKITSVKATIPSYLRKRGAKRIVGPRMLGRRLEDVLPGIIKRYAQTPINHLCVLTNEYAHRS